MRNAPEKDSVIVEVFKVPTQAEYEKLAERTSPIAQFIAREAFEPLLDAIPGKQIVLSETSNFDPVHALPGTWWPTVYHGVGNQLSGKELDIAFKEGFVFTITRQIAKPTTDKNSREEDLFGQKYTVVNRAVLQKHAEDIKGYLASLAKEHPEVTDLGRIYQQLKVQEEKVLKAKKKDEVLSEFIDRLNWYLTFLINISYDQFVKNGSAKIPSGNKAIADFMLKERAELKELGIKILIFYKDPIPL